MFDTTSRYYSIDNATLNITDADGQPQVVVYKRRRFIPPTDNLITLVQYTFTQGDRLDNITARYLSDPTLFWRICDANNVLQPAELEVVGRTIEIAVPGV